LDDSSRVAGVVLVSGTFASDETLYSAALRAWSQPELVLWRLGYLVAMCGGGAAVAAFVLVIAAGGRGGGAALEAAGVAAVIGALGLLGALVRRSELRSSS
jgi:hypothetical protein